MTILGRRGVGTQTVCARDVLLYRMVEELCAEYTALPMSSMPTATPRKEWKRRHHGTPSLRTLSSLRLSLSFRLFIYKCFHSILYVSRTVNNLFFVCLLPSSGSTLRATEHQTFPFSSLRNNPLVEKVTSKSYWCSWR